MLNSLFTASDVHNTSLASTTWHNVVIQLRQLMFHLQSLKRKVGNTQTAVVTSRLPRRDMHKGVNHYSTYTEETPASPILAHTWGNPAVAATILFSFMCSNITLVGEGAGGGSISSVHNIVPFDMDRAFGEHILPVYPGLQTATNLLTFCILNSTS